MIQRVAFTMLPVRDPARARSFYEGRLGLTVGSHSPNGMWTEYDLPGGGCLALFHTSDLAPSSEAGATLALEVDDLDAEKARLAGLGVTIKIEEIRSPVCRMAVILDSEGNGILLHQLHDPGSVASARTRKASPPRRKTASRAKPKPKARPQPKSKASKPAKTGTKPKSVKKPRPQPRKRR